MVRREGCPWPESGPEAGFYEDISDHRGKGGTEGVSDDAKSKTRSQKAHLRPEIIRSKDPHGLGREWETWEAT